MRRLKNMKPIAVLLCVFAVVFAVHSFGQQDASMKLTADVSRVSPAEDINGKRKFSLIDMIRTEPAQGSSDNIAISSSASVKKASPQLDSMPYETTQLTDTPHAACEALFVLGGREQGNGSVVYSAFNDVWKVTASTTNINATSGWTPVTVNAPWSARAYFGSLVKDGKIWVLGGLSNTVPYVFNNDVWSSPDGANWTQVTANAPWPARWDFGAVEFNGKIFIFGGVRRVNNAFVWMNDVWYSSDGVNWAQAANAPWSARASFATDVHSGKIWIFGGELSNGTITNDVWSSSDGVMWTQVASNTAPTGRIWGDLVSFSNKLWLIGGYAYNPLVQNFNEVWTYNGSQWNKFDHQPYVAGVQNAEWQPLSQHAAVVFKNRIWILGGMSGQYNTGGAIPSFTNAVWTNSFTFNAPWTVYDSDINLPGIQNAPWAARGGHRSAVLPCI